MPKEGRTIDSLLKAGQSFDPPPSFRERAWVKGGELHRLAEKDFEGFWAKMAADLVTFRAPWTKVLEWDLPHAKWFVGAKLNVAENCLDRHVQSWRRNKAAMLWEGEPGDRRVVTYQELYDETCRVANALRSLGVRRGDRVTISMPMVPELAATMLACARIGAPHSVIFGGFSAKSIADRIHDAESKVVVTADGGFRRGNVVRLKDLVDEALGIAKGVVENVLVLRRTAHDVRIRPKRDIWWHDLVPEQPRACPAEAMDAEDMLFMLYTSGTTGKPKGIVHTTAGYLVGVAATHKYIFDLKDDDVYWCTADIGWITGHSYIVYGPLANGATVVMYEGAPDHPKPDRFWQIVERYRVNTLYTAPTVIRAFMRWGDRWPKGHDLTSLRLLGTVGEPINPEAWLWYHRVIGGGRCPVVDTWWQTENGMILITPLPGATRLKPGSATTPFPGIAAKVVDSNGKEVPRNTGGFLVITRPWPGMLRALYKDPDRFVSQYWSQVPGAYFTGDGARQDEDGYFWLMGRIDDVINVSAHRLGTMEIESALVSHPSVSEAAVVGAPHEVTGQCVVAFVLLKSGQSKAKRLRDELKAHVKKEIGSLAVPETIYLVDKLPKTRSGKIMRRVMRAVVSGEDVGDVTTLEDPGAVDEVRAWLKALKK
jgi:acetyl-CoA synthetase